MSILARNFQTASFLTANSWLSEQDLHEWTHGCSAQYKCWHCMGDISFYQQDFRFCTIRIFFETSYAQDPQHHYGRDSVKWELLQRLGLQKPTLYCKFKHILYDFLILSHLALSVKLRRIEQTWVRSKSKLT